MLFNAAKKFRDQEVSGVKSRMWKPLDQTRSHQVYSQLNRELNGRSSLNSSRKNTAYRSRKARLNRSTFKSTSDLFGNGTAYNIGDITGDYTFTSSNSVDNTNPVDYFQFRLSSISNFNLSITGMTADADVALLGPRQSFISQNPGSVDETLYQQLVPGDYSIRVSSYKGASTDYFLTLSASGADVDPGNTLAAARDLGEMGRTTRTRNDSINSTDSHDYYRFEVRESTTFNLSLTGLQDDLDVKLMDIGGAQIALSENDGSQSEAMNGVLKPGTYYLDVYRFLTSNGSSYTLKLDGSRYVNANPAFNSTYGYGLVNAAAAVAEGLNQTPFSNVSDLGGLLWGDDLVNAPEVWARGYTGRGVTVAVIDSGVDITHPDLANNIWRNLDEVAGNGIDDDGNGYIDDVYGWNFGVGQNNNDVTPGTTFNDHGTHVAGIIAAARNNIGMTGAAPDAKIMAIRLGDVNPANFFDNPGSLATAIRYAVNNGANVINLSLGWSNSLELRDALAYAADHNVVVVSAAGNNAIDSPGNPAQYAIDEGIAVGAIDAQQTIAGFSNLAGSDSRMQYVVAPGVKIYSTLPGGQYGFLDGTSMASPYVAGVAALMLSANPYLTAAQVQQILTNTATYLA